MRCTQVVPAHSGNYSKGRSAPIDKIVLHAMSGTFAGTAAWFSKARPGGTSSHFGISQTGQVAIFVSAADTAFHAGVTDENARSIGIELEDGSKGRYLSADWATDAQYVTAASLVACLANQYRIPLDKAHVVGHKDVNANRDCPGEHWDWNRFWQAVASQVQKAPDG